MSKPSEEELDVLGKDLEYSMLWTQEAGWGVGACSFLDPDIVLLAQLQVRSLLQKELTHLHRCGTGEIFIETFDFAVNFLFLPPITESVYVWTETLCIQNQLFDSVIEMQSWV